MKTKYCEVLLVEKVPSRLLEIIEKIEDAFENVYRMNFRETISEDKTEKDFRINIRFESNKSKNEIYKKMNLIKSNPIKFINN